MGPYLSLGGPGAHLAHFVCDMRPENIQMLPRIHIFQGTALNETDLCGISSPEIDGWGAGPLCLDQQVWNTTPAEVAIVPGF